ncbi:MAG TPA: Yip1 family protein [Steroidobacteraceae bacterium]|jgi:uncharacterized membrane protein YuzA (DUF378 family)
MAGAGGAGTESFAPQDSHAPSGLIARVRGILLAPKQEWPRIAAESGSAISILQRYTVPLAAFLAVVSFIHVSIIGISIPFAGTVRTPIVGGILNAVLTCVMAVIGVCVVAVIINALAPRFGGTKEWRQAVKVSAYSLTPGFLSSVFGLLPALSTLLALLAGIYGIYVLYLGLPVVMRSRRERAGAYTAWVVICTILLGIVIGAASAMLGIGSGRMLSGMNPLESREAQRERGAATVANVLGNALGTDEKGKAGLTAALSNLAKTGEQVEAQTAAKGPGSAADTSAAQSSAPSSAATSSNSTAGSSGSADSPQSALGAAGGLLTALGGAMGGAHPKAPVDFHKLQDALPNSVSGLPRTHIEAGTKQAIGVKSASARATYGSGATRVEIEISDMSGVAGLMDLASVLPVDEASESDTGYDKHIALGGRAAEEKFDTRSKHGELSTIVGKRFSVDVTSDGLSPSDLEKALAQVNLSSLESMKNAGGQP